MQMIEGTGPGTEIHGPFLPEYRVTVDGYKVPYISATPGDDGRVYVTCDNRFGMADWVSREEFDRWLPFMAQAMAVAAGYGCHGENSGDRPVNPFRTRMSRIGSIPAQLTVIEGGYTGCVDEAGRYTREEAEAEAQIETRISAHPLSAFQSKPAPSAEAVAKDIVNSWYDECMAPEDEPPQLDWPKLIERVAAALRSPAIPAPWNDALEQAAIALMKRRDQCAAHADNPKIPAASQEVWAELANENFDGARAIRAMKCIHPTIPAPAQGVTVTDEMVRKAIAAYWKDDCPWFNKDNEERMLAALEAALHPAEKE